MSALKACATCRFYLSMANDGVKRPHGICTRFPPTFTGGETFAPHKLSAWKHPAVSYFTTRCGEYVHKDYEEDFNERD